MAIMGIRSSNGENTVSLGFGLQFSTYLFYDDNMRERERERDCRQKLEGIAERRRE